MESTEKVKEGWYIITTNNQEQSVGYIRQKISSELQIQYLDQKTCVMSLGSIHSLIQVDENDVRNSYRKNKSLGGNYSAKALKNMQDALADDPSFVNSAVGGIVITDDL